MEIATKVRGDSGSAQFSNAIALCKSVCSVAISC
jgi:hypothetical protein